MSKAITVEYFAQSRQLSGVSREVFELNDNAGLDELLGEVVARYGEPMQRLIGGRSKPSPGLVIAVRGRQVSLSEPCPLQNGDDVVLVPAISGG